MDVFDENTINSSDSSDEDDSEIIDGNTCSDLELTELFTSQYHLSAEECVSLKKTYILHMAASKTFERIVIGTSCGSIQFYDIRTGLSKLKTPDCLNGLTSFITGVKYANSSLDSVLVSTTESVLMVDLRSDDIAHTFCDDRESVRKKHFNCFDINNNDRIICVGTQQRDQEVYLTFFDVRKQSLLGAYWDSHHDDITDVKFHLKNPDLVLSGSTDGLICAFDISQTNEDEALLSTLNTESSVASIDWHETTLGKDIASCITHTNDLQLFDVSNLEDAEMLKTFDRETVTKHMKRRSVMDCSLINCHSTMDDEILLIASSNYDKGKCLRSLAYRNETLVPSTDFIGNKQIVRTSVLNKNTNTLLTGGENGLITLWSTGAMADSKTNIKSSNLKEKTYKKHKMTPY
ncbi:WD repeat-containing protein 89 [Pseudolycoriella hygida]|uniref:WD repeat-containing protein 89 n=1 Tax=Pseudolycoriella hygida TaxID=35572 RepID=A0A9Q0N4B1_9DIPT|nr:WD repeat-containing protein 89 [Pseudolycoriella hygida]